MPHKPNRRIVKDSAVLGVSERADGHFFVIVDMMHDRSIFLKALNGSERVEFEITPSDLRAMNSVLRVYDEPDVETDDEPE